LKPPLDRSKPATIVIKNKIGLLEKPASPHRKRIYVSVNACAFVFNQIERRMRELYELLLEFDLESSQKKPLRAEQVSLDIGYKKRNEIVGLAWDIVDWMDRLRKILNSVSGVKRKTGWYKDLTDALSHAESLRNLFQHFDGNIKKFVDGSYPIMGSITAIYQSGAGAYARVVVSTPARFAGDSEMHIEGFVLPTSATKPLENVTLAVGKDFANLTAIFQSIERARPAFAAELKSKYGFAWPTE
jgi:hypothetical protein